jgi:hypothetical protein
MQNGPAVSLYLTLFGIVAGFVSTFWSFGYTRLARRLKGYLQGELRRVRKSDVVFTLQNGCWINILGMAATLLGLQVCDPDHSSLPQGERERIFASLPASKG